MHPARLSLAALLSLSLSACATYGASSIERADVPMRDAAGRDLGTLSLTSSSSGLMLSGVVRGLPPGERAIHVHTTGRCDPTFEAAGPHWNPTSRMHGRENPQGAHLGDMPNVRVGPDSSATVRVMTAGGTLRGTLALMDADGGAVVIHESADDHRTDPSGESGARIACGVVRGS